MNLSDVQDEQPPSGDDETQSRWYEEQKARRGFIGVFFGSKEQVVVYGVVVCVMSIVGILGYSVYKYPDTISDTLVPLRYMFATMIGFVGGFMRK